jgi:hypothetical protein
MCYRLAYKELKLAASRGKDDLHANRCMGATLAPVEEV